jgi:hypothetical protein
VELREVSPISPWAELPRKGTEKWIRFREKNWREEAKRLIETFKWWKKCGDQFWMDKEERRFWRLKHLEIPFISYPGRDDPYDSIKDIPWNQEAIQEMIKVNPLFKEPEWAEKLQDWVDLEGAEARKEKRRRRWAEERRAIEELQLQEYQRRQREEQAQALVQNQRSVFVEQNLGQWIREIEEDERRRIETPTERHTRERRQEIQDYRRFLVRDGSF